MGPFSIPISPRPWLTLSSSLHKPQKIELKAFAFKRHLKIQTLPKMNPNKLIEMARKCQKVSALAKRASSTKKDAQLDSDVRSTPVVEKEHFVVYTTDSKRFTVPLAFLESTIFVELLKMSEDELGLPSDGPTALYSDAVFMEYVLLLLRRRGTKAMDRVLLGSVFRHQHSPCSSHFY